MIGGLKPYPEMRPSGLPWLGDVPAHWEVRRIKTLLTEVDSRSQHGRERLLSLRMRHGLVDHLLSGGKTIPPENLIGFKNIEVGQIVMNRMRAAYGLFGIARSEGLVSPDYAVFAVRNGVHAQYLIEAFKMPQLGQMFRSESKGLGTGEAGFLRLYTDRFGPIAVPHPPLEEQRLIMRFLNWHGAQTAKLIRIKKKYIALLRENKQAIIHQAITGGLDSRYNAEKSNVLWFDDVPEGWKILTLRRVIRRAVDGPHHSPSYLDEGIPFLSARNIKVDRWSLDDVKYISETDFNDFSRRVKPECGDVLYTKGGTTGIARAVDLDFRFQVWVHIAVLKLDRAKVHPNFLSMVLNSPRCYEQSQLFTRGATNQDLGLGRMKDIILCLPPLSKQEELIRYCDSETQGIVESIQRVNDEVKLIAEFRTRLIADVVTGKLDVRAAAASLPAVAEPDPADAPADEDDLDEAADAFEDEEAAA